MTDTIRDELAAALEPFALRISERIGDDHLADNQHITISAPISEVRAIRAALARHRAAKEAEPDLVEALDIGRRYVYSVHTMIAGAMGHERTIVKPDLDKIDAALRKAQGHD